MLMRRTELSLTTNVSAEYETATFAKPLLGAGVLSVVALLSIVYGVFVRWLGSSFAFFCLAFALAKNANVLPNALAKMR
jgi:uncharacterized membrane protein YphA (DoxX/SURF4 family)